MKMPRKMHCYRTKSVIHFRLFEISILQRFVLRTFVIFIVKNSSFQILKVCELNVPFPDWEKLLSKAFGGYQKWSGKNKTIKLYIKVFAHL